eukprot:271777_1
MSFKQNFKKGFHKFVSSELFNKLINILKLTKFKYEPIQTEHREELINFISNTYSYRYSGNDSFKIFQPTSKEMNIIVAPEIDNLLHIGGGIVIKDMHSEIIPFVGLSDAMDGFIASNNTASYLSTSQMHQEEIYHFVKNDFVSELKQNKNQYNYGIYIHPQWLSIHPKCRHIGLRSLLDMFIEYCCITLRYKYMVMISTNLITGMRKKKNLMWNLCDIQTKTYDYSSFQFNDGTSMQYYFDRLKQEHMCNDKVLNKRKKECQLTTIHGTYSVGDINEVFMESIFIFAAKKYIQRMAKRSKSKL